LKIPSGFLTGCSQLPEVYLGIESPFFQQEQLGFAVFEMGPYSCSI
jgi:hypothetical protein